MKIVWLSVNASHSHFNPAPALLQAQTLGRVPTSWHLLTCTPKDDIAELTSKVVEQKPQVLAASLFLFNREFTLNILARCRTLLPDCKIIVGGPECLGDHQPLLQSGIADAAVRGEGETPFSEWLLRLQNNAPWDNIPGLTFRSAENNLVDGGRPLPFTSFADAPPVCRSELFPLDKPFVQFETARGCPNSCLFCTSGNDHPLRLKSLSAVAAELREFRDAGIREFRILDRTFNTNPKRCVALLRLFRQEFPELKFHLEIHPAQLTQSIRDELSQALPEQLHVEAGIQSLQAKTLSAIKRAGSPEKTLEGLRFLTANPNFETHADLLAGLPEQTFGELLADLVLLLETNPAEIQLETLKILPGTPLRAQAMSLGLLYSPLPPYDVLQTPSLSVADLAWGRSLSRLLDRFYNTALLQQAFRMQVDSNTEQLLHLLELAQEAGMLGAPVNPEKRFRFFHRIADKPVREHLEFKWLQSGFSPDHGLCKTAYWRDEIPPTAEKIQGNATIDFSRARIRHARQERQEYWFVYDRRLDRRRPIQIFRKKI